MMSPLGLFDISTFKTKAWIRLPVTVGNDSFAYSCYYVSEEHLVAAKAFKLRSGDENLFAMVLAALGSAAIAPRPPWYQYSQISHPCIQSTFDGTSIFISSIGDDSGGLVGYNFHLDPAETQGAEKVTEAANQMFSFLSAKEPQIYIENGFKKDSYWSWKKFGFVNIAAEQEQRLRSLQEPTQPKEW